jgi:Zn-dependent protease with chaperone function
VNAFDASYYDGRSAQRRAVRVWVVGERLHVVGEGVELAVALAEVEVDSPIPGAPRNLRLPGGAQLRADEAAVAELFAGRHRLESLVERLERRWLYALGALVLLIGCAWWFVALGLPLAAAALAAHIPLRAEAAIGDQALAAIEGRICSSSALSAGEQATLQRNFSRMTAGLNDGHQYRLLLRSCPAMGANAFALPGGAIILTDQLVRLGGSPDGISGVLAHEIGHVRQRHGLRTLLQGAGLIALITTVAGDAAAITSLAVTLPTVLLQSGYSREFEAEADAFAVQRMHQLGLSPRAFADMLALIDRNHVHAGKGEKQDYFSTHPITAARIERALAAETDFDRCVARSLGAERQLGACSSAIASGKLSGPELAAAYAIRGQIQNAMGLQQAAIEDLDRALGSGSRDADVYNALAWILATSPQDALRNAARGKELALTACELTRYQNPNIVDTLAAAHAEAGEFADAVRLQKQALESPDFDKRYVKEGRERLALYEAGRPYREAPR